MDQQSAGMLPLTKCTGRNWNSLVGNRCKKHSISIRKQFLALLTKCWGNFLCIYTYLVTTRDVQFHFFQELDHSQSLPKKSEPATITHIHEFLFSKNMSHDHSRSWKSSWCKPRICMKLFYKNEMKDFFVKIWKKEIVVMDYLTQIVDYLSQIMSPFHTPLWT